MKPRVIKNCLICRKEFCVLYARRYLKYCSKECGYKATSIKRKLNNPQGFKKRNQKLPISLKEYNTLHHWINRNFEKIDICEICKKSGLKGKFINWANKNNFYDRKRENWIRLCRKCHYWYDLHNV